MVPDPVTSNILLQDSQNNTLGYVLQTRTDQWNHLGVETTAIGQPVVAGSSTATLVQDSGTAGYVAVCFTDYPLGGQPSTVIGFGYLGRPGNGHLSRRIPRPARRRRFR